MINNLIIPYGYYWDNNGINDHINYGYYMDNISG